MSGKPIEWGESMATGLLWQDLQHKTLIESINSLRAAIMQRTGRDHVQRMVDFLESYAQHHFAIEEQYMQTYHDPREEQHLREHRQFSSAVQDLKNNAAPMGELSAEALYFDLYEWITTHIMHTDRVMADFIRSAAAD